MKWFERGPVFIRVGRDVMREAGMMASQRAEYLSTMSRHPLDLLVVGGGITGAGIALDAASRGLCVGLVEKGDFASGTSSRSTKLIHGGLRYLKQGDVKLVREVGRERAILYRNAPHLVIPEKMLLPVVEGGTYGKAATSVGLYVYDVLAGVERAERRKMLRKEATLCVEPLLRDDILRGAGLYFEYRTDDARLTIEVIKTAVQFGAICCNYAEVTEFLYEESAGERKMVGAAVTDKRSRQTYNICARVVVNAAGPWVDELRAADDSLRGKRLHLTKGIHIVVPHERLPLRQSVYFDVPDGRMVFAIPRDGITYIGTTDTDYHGDINQPRATKQDVEYLLGAANAIFPSVRLILADVESSWAGLRPLIHEDGKSASDLSRKDEIFTSPSGLLSMAGGKLTGYRKMAERLVNRVMQKLGAEDGRAYVPCQTADIPLSGGTCRQDLSQEVRAALESKLNEHDAARVRRLLDRYGSNAPKLLEYVPSRSCDDFSDPPLLHWILAEWAYAVDHEMATNVSDFLIRRTGRVVFERHMAAAVYQRLHEEYVRRFPEDAEQHHADLLEFEAELAASVGFFAED